MNDPESSPGQRNRDERRAFVEAAINMLFKVNGGPTPAMEALLERYVEGEISLTQLTTELVQGKTL